MVERRQHLTWGLPPWQRNHRDYTQAFLARRNTARGLPGWDPKRFLQPVKPKPLLQPIREEADESEQSQDTFDVKSPRFRNSPSDQERSSLWSGTTIASTSTDNLSQIARESVYEPSSRSKGHKWQKIGQTFLAMQPGCRAENPQGEINMDKAWSEAIQNLASRLEDIMNLARRSHDASELKSGPKIFKDPSYGRSLAKKPELANIPAIPKLSDFSEKSQLQAYLNPEPEAPTMCELPAYSEHGDITKIQMPVEPPAVERESSAGAGVPTQGSNMPKTIYSSRTTSDLQGSPKNATRNPIPAGHHRRKPLSPTAQLQTKMPENGWSQDQFAETTIQVLQEEIKILQQEKACILEEIGLLQKDTAPELEKKGNRLLNENAPRNLELEIALAFRQRALVRQDFEEVAALKAQRGRDSLAAQKAMSKRKLELDRMEAELLQRERDVVLRESKAMPWNRVTTTGQVDISEPDRDAAEREQDVVSQNLTAWLLERPVSLPRSEALSQRERQRQFVPKSHTMPKSRMLSLRELNEAPMNSEAFTGLEKATTPNLETNVGECLRTDMGGHEPSLKTHAFHTKQTRTASEHESLATTSSFRTLPELGRRARNGANTPSCPSDPYHLSQSFEQREWQPAESAPAFQHAVYIDHAGTKRKIDSKDATGRPSIQAQSGLVSSIRRNAKRGQYDDYGGSDDEYDDSDDGNPKRRKEIPSKSTPPQRDLACPYSKHDMGRYSQRNLTEKRYRGCSKCLFPDVSRLNSSESLDQHAQQTVSCRVQTCPFPEKFTSDQAKQLRKKWTGKSAKECWYIIFRILFPLGQPPSSPYADEFHLPSPDAPQMLRQIVFERLRQHQHSQTTAQLMSDEVQGLLGQTIEDSLIELFCRLTPAANYNTQSGSSALDGNASDDYGSGDHDSNNHEFNIADIGSDQVVEDQSHTTQHGSEDAIDLPTASTKNDFTLPASNARPTCYEQSNFGNTAHFDSGQYELFNSSFSPPENYVNESSRRAAENPSAVPHHQLSLCETPSDYTRRPLRSSVSVPATQSGHSALCLDNPQYTWSGALPTSHIPTPAFVTPSLPATTFDSKGLYLPTHAGRCSQQPPQKSFEPSIYSFDSGYGSMRFQQESQSSFGWSSENVTISEPGLPDTIAESWSHNDGNEAELSEGARKSSRISAFAESRTSHHPAATF